MEPKKVLTPAKPVTGTESGPGSTLTGPRIRCPRCSWEPPAGELWACVCGCHWHAFDTGGVCPECIKQWENTQCHQCHVWSPHSSWYEY